MKRLHLGILVLALAVSMIAATASADLQVGVAAPDFPPGSFSDGGHYTLNDFKGKVLVIFFYESNCPRCRGMVPDRNKLVVQYKDKPVKFIAVSPHEPLFSVRNYIKGTGLAMPVFADPLLLMEKRYSENISLNNIYQFKVIGPDGKLAAYMVGAELDRVVAAASWKFKDQGYDPALNLAIDLLEWNQYEAGMAALNPLRTSSSKTVAASAEKLYTAMTAEGEKWKSDADAALAGNPSAAYDLYTRIANCFPKSDLAQAAEDALKKLRVDPAVKDELAARQMYAQLTATMAKVTAADKNQVIAFCKTIVTRYPKTPTGEKVAALLTEMSSSQ